MAPQTPDAAETAPDTGTAATGGEQAASTEDVTAAETPDAEGKIAVLLPETLSSERWENDDRPAFEAAFQAAGLSDDDYIILNAEGDPNLQRTQAEQVIADGARVVVFTNNDPGSGIAIVDYLKSQGASVIDYDRLTLDADADYWVSGDPYEAGELQGTGLIDCVAAAGVTDPSVAILSPPQGDSWGKELSDGYHSKLDEKFSSDWTLVEEQNVKAWDTQEALLIFEQMLERHENINAVLAANDSIAAGAIAALKARGLEPVPMTGLDATTEALQNIISGWQCMTVYFSIKEQATLAANLAVELLRGQEPTGITGETDNGKKSIPTVIIHPETVTKDNIADTVIADGWRTWDEICEGEYAQYCPPEASQ